VSLRASCTRKELDIIPSDPEKWLQFWEPGLDERGKE
jgi:hypothetical protein